MITQHQDCTATVIKTTEAKGAFTVGYHADAESLAPKGWLTGSEWKWGPLYIDLVKTVLDGKKSSIGPGFEIPTLGKPLSVKGNTLIYDRPLLVTKANVDQFSGF